MRSRNLKASDLLDAWDRAGTSGRPASRALAILAEVEPEAEPRSWSIGRRDRALLELHRRWFGTRLSSIAHCRACGEAIELEFGIDDLETKGADAVDGMVEIEGHRIAFRVLTSEDVELALAEPTPERRERKLIERAILSITSDEEERNISALSTDAIAELGRAIASLDPDSDISIEAVCPGCGQASELPFDISAHLCAELDRFARGLLEEVHLLASAYGWTEREILALSPSRRRAYLDMVGR